MRAIVGMIRGGVAHRLRSDVPFPCESRAILLLRAPPGRTEQQAVRGAGLLPRRPNEPTGGGSLGMLQPSGPVCATRCTQEPQARAPVSPRRAPIVREMSFIMLN